MVRRVVGVAMLPLLPALGTRHPWLLALVLGSLARFAPGLVLGGGLARVRASPWLAPLALSLELAGGAVGLVVAVGERRVDSRREDGALRHCLHVLDACLLHVSHLPGRRLVVATVTEHAGLPGCLLACLEDHEHLVHEERASLRLLLVFDLHDGPHVPIRGTQEANAHVGQGAEALRARPAVIAGERHADQLLQIGAQGEVVHVVLGVAVADAVPIPSHRSVILLELVRVEFVALDVVVSDHAPHTAPIGGGQVPEGAGELKEPIGPEPAMPVGSFQPVGLEHGVPALLAFVQRPTGRADPLCLEEVTQDLAVCSVLVHAWPRPGPPVLGAMVPLVVVIAALGASVVRVVSHGVIVVTVVVLAAAAAAATLPPVALGAGAASWWRFVVVAQAHG